MTRTQWLFVLYLVSSLHSFSSFGGTLRSPVNFCSLCPLEDRYPTRWAIYVPVTDRVLLHGLTTTVVLTQSLGLEKPPRPNGNLRLQHPCPSYNGGRDTPPRLPQTGPSGKHLDSLTVDPTRLDRREHATTRTLSSVHGSCTWVSTDPWCPRYPVLVSLLTPTSTRPETSRITLHSKTVP